VCCVYFVLCVVCILYCVVCILCCVLCVFCIVCISYCGWTNSEVSSPNIPFIPSDAANNDGLHFYKKCLGWMNRNSIIVVTLSVCLSVLFCLFIGWFSLNSSHLIDIACSVLDCLWVKLSDIWLKKCRTFSKVFN